MSKTEKLEEDLLKIQQELLGLDNFRDTSFLRRFQRQLEGEKSELKAKIVKLTQTNEQKTVERQQRIEKANQNRSSKMIRNWTYLKAVQKNYFPDKSLTEIRSLLKKHRQGLETDIPDIAWRNPSP